MAVTQMMLQTFTSPGEGLLPSHFGEKNMMTQRALSQKPEGTELAVLLLESSIAVCACLMSVSSYHVSG